MIDLDLESTSGWADVLEPKWLTEARSEVSGASPEVVDCACRLISGVVKGARGEAIATMEVIYKDNQSHIRVVWGRDLDWVVSPTNGKPWPVVNVKLYGSLSALCSKRTRSTQGTQCTQDHTQANWVVSRSLELLGYPK